MIPSFDCANSKFHVTSLGIIDYPKTSAHLLVDYTVNKFSTAQSLFFGLGVPVVPERIETKKWVVAFTVHLRTGSVRDEVYGFDQLARCKNAPFKPGSSLRVGLELEKHGDVYLPVILVGGESIPHPALHLPELESMECFGGAEIGPHLPLFEAQETTISLVDQSFSESLKEMLCS